jgi:hypothetical protein
MTFALQDWKTAAKINHTQGFLYSFMYNMLVILHDQLWRCFHGLAGHFYKLFYTKRNDPTMLDTLYY